jgi:hypothetical protein
MDHNAPWTAGRLGGWNGGVSPPSRGKSGTRNPSVSGEYALVQRWHSFT